MSSPFTLWSSIADVFVTGTGALDGEDWSFGNVTDGGSPIWLDNWTPATAYSTTAASTYTIQLTSEDLVGSVQPMITVATETLINPFDPREPGGGNLGAAMVFTSNSETGRGGVAYWTASATTPGDYALDFQGLTTNYVSAPSTGPNTTLTGSATTLIGAVAAPMGWDMNWGSSDFVLAYGTTASAGTKDIWLQGFTSAGVAESAAVEAFSGVSDATQYLVAHTASSDAYDLDYTVVNGSQTGWYDESFDPSTGALGAPTEMLSLANYSTIFDIGYRILSDGSQIRFVSGTIGSQQVLQVFSNADLTKTIDLAGATADRWASAGVYDPATGKSDYTALIYSKNDKVHLDLFDASGVEIGAPERVAGLTSFDRIHEMGNGSRVEIDYTYTDSAGGDQIGAVIYDTATGGYDYTLTTGGEYVGTPFDDVFKVTSTTSGDDFIDGGGGADRLHVAAAANAVQFTTGADGFLEVVTAGASVTLDGFATVKLSDERIGLAGTSNAPEIELGADGELQLEGTLASDYTIAFAAGGGQVTLEADSSLGASLATWRKGDSVVFDAVDYASSDSLLFVPNASHSGGVLELLNASDVDIADLFKVTGGSRTTSDFSLKSKGTFAEIAFA